MRALEVIQTGYIVSRVTNLLSGFREESVGGGEPNVRSKSECRCRPPVLWPVRT